MRKTDIEFLGRQCSLEAKPVLSSVTGPGGAGRDVGDSGLPRGFCF